jgi:SRSO17 transposase
MIINRKQYIEYLISTPVNYTGSNLAQHLEQVSHDAVSDFLRQERVTASDLYKLVRPLLQDSTDSYLLVDDSVQDKRYSSKIELVKRQYSGNEHGLVRGIGIVNLVHSDGTNYYPIDFRVYAPATDGKTKNDHFAEMFVAAVETKQLQAQTVLFDSWYASVANLKLIQQHQRYFVTTLKSNRMVSLSVEGGYVHLEQVEWDALSLEQGHIVKLKELPFKVKLFKLVATNGDIEWVITNHPSLNTAHAVKESNSVRWQIEQFHRELKQLTGSEKCESRRERAQRNHIALCYQAWLAIKVAAQKANQSAYQIVKELWSDWLRAELRSPHILALTPS